MSDIQDTFMLFSTRDDGKIEAKFIGEVVRALGLNPTEADIRRCGYNDPEQRIDFATFVPIFQTLQKNREQTSMDELVQGFRVFDKEQNGLIRAAELRHLLTSLGEKLRDDEVEQLLSGLEDSQGNINYEEFVKNILSG